MPPVPLAGVLVTECIQFARRILAEAVHRIGEARASYRLVYCGDLFGNVIEFTVNPAAPPVDQTASLEASTE